MKSLQVLVPLLVLVLLAVCAYETEAQSHSAEAKKRKDTCGELVKKKGNGESGSDSDSGEGDSKSDESNDSGSDSNGDGDSDSSDGDSSDSGKADDSDSGDADSDESNQSGSDSNGDGDSNSSGADSSGSGTAGDSDSGSGGQDSGEPGQCICATGQPGISRPTGPTVSRPSKKPRHHRFHCDLTDALRNVSVVLTVEQRVIFEEFIRSLEITILIDMDLTDIEKVVKCSKALKKFFELNVDIYHKIAFEHVAGWGFFIDFVYVSIDIQAEITIEIVTLDENDSCTMFEALLNATQGDSQKHAAVIVLIEELKIVLKDGSLTHAEKMKKVSEHFKLFFEMHAEWESFFLEIEIEGYGSFESFIDVCKGYKKALTISSVIGGSSADCVVCKALDEAVANTSFTLSVRAQLKQLRDKITVYFDSEVSVELRLKYITSQCYQMFLVEEFIHIFLDLIEMKVDGEEWGTFYDLRWCSQFCKNSGSCGPIGGRTTVAPSSTPAPASCSKRPELIVITAQNTTYLTDVLTQHYNSWNSTTKLGFNTCFNGVRRAIWNHAMFPTPGLKISEIVKVFLAYNTNNAEKQKVLMDIELVVWGGKVKKFCDCGSG